ncbi:MAG: crossover junction endodeoxyribonuclease RuvC [Chloroflexi bacterium]|nr:crossover junction endodeoxyribonuclease RuvC [Chloroflexota bacterium]
MLVLGIDPGTATTGYGVVNSEGGALSLVSYGVIETPAGTPLPERLQMIYRGVTEVVRRCGPAEAAVEELFFSKNARTALAVGHGRGVALLALADAGLPVSEYKPAQIKQAITGYGQADKRQMQEMVRLLLGLESLPKPDDAADALAIAICHTNTQRLGALLGS